MVETQGSNAEHDEQKMTKFLETAMSNGAIADGTVTNEETKMKVRICEMVILVYHNWWMSCYRTFGPLEKELLKVFYWMVTSSSMTYHCQLWISMILLLNSGID